MAATRFDPFAAVSCRYGAPMGRLSDNLAAFLDGSVPLSRMAARHQGGGGGYDKGGAYWGSPCNVWAVWHAGHAEDGVIYVRAWSRDEAIREALNA